MPDLQQDLLTRSHFKETDMLYGDPYDCSDPAIGIASRPAYRDWEGSTQLIVPLCDTEGKMIGTKTVHARFCPELSRANAIWRGQDGQHYHLVDKAKYLANQKAFEAAITEGA